MGSTRWHLGSGIHLAAGSVENDERLLLLHGRSNAREGLGNVRMILSLNCLLPGALRMKDH